jgi:hypothetical protein
MEDKPLTVQNPQSRTAKARAIAAEQGKSFMPGVSANPGGKPVGARNRLQGKFLNTLADDFEKHGKEAIEAMRRDDPSAYVRAVASLMPKELEVKRPLEELTDDELSSAIDALRSFVVAQNAPKGSGAKSGGKPAPGLHPVH